jgi:hypothetical protein
MTRDILANRPTCRDYSGAARSHAPRAPFSGHSRTRCVGQRGPGFNDSLPAGPNGWGRPRVAADARRSRTARHRRPVAGELPAKGPDHE